MKNNKFDFQKLFSNKSFVIPFSIICALVMWIVIVVNQNPVREQVFSDVTAAITLDNTAAAEMGLGIVTDISDYKFTVTVSGPNYIVSSLKTDDFKLTADVTNINSAGTHTLKIIGTRNSSKSGYSFVSISPATVDVTFDFIDTKTFEITPKLIGVSAADGLVAETPIPSNSEQNTISIKGPRSIVKKIDLVGSVAEVNKTLSSTQSYDSYVVLYDKNGDVLYRYTLDGKVFNGNDEEIYDRRLTLSYTSLKITQPISKKKTVAVTPTFTNLPAGVDSSQFAAQVNIPTVNVIGTPEVIDKLTELTLSPIDVKSVSVSNTSFEIAPTLPEGVRLVDSVDYFTVTLNMERFLEKSITVSEVKFENLAGNLKARKTAVIKNVKICGAIDVIQSINENDFYAKVDLTDKNAGEYTVDAVITSSKNNSVWVCGTYTVTVKIE